VQAIGYYRLVGADCRDLTVMSSPSRAPVSIGWTARKDYLSRVPHPPAGGSEEVPDTDTYCLATGFKLLLQNPEDPSASQLPPGVNAVQV
jgi:hypothetical protein